MTTPKIHDLVVTDLKIIPDDRGAVMHMLRADAPHFRAFGEIYFSMINSKRIKGWKRHHEMTLNLASPHGRVELVVYDDRPNSPSFGALDRIVLGPDDRYALVTVPPMLWSGLRNIGKNEAIIANCATIPHRPTEADARPIDDPVFPVVWSTA